MNQQRNALLLLAAAASSSAASPTIDLEDGKEVLANVSFSSAQKSQQGLVTPGPQDIPVPVPGSWGLAGDLHPDISRFIAVRTVTATSISPTGDSIAYISDSTGVPQVWVSSRKTNEKRQVTFFENGVVPDVVHWSPNGRWIAYAADAGGNERFGFYAVSPDGLTERELLAPSEAFRGWGGWSPKGERFAYSSTERNGDDYDVYIADVDSSGRTRQTKRVYEGKGGLYVEEWSPNGKFIILTKTRGELDRDVSLLDVKTGKAELIFAPKEPASYMGFCWTPDSKKFYVSTNMERDFLGLAHYDVENKKLKWVHTPKADIDRVALSKDGRYLVWASNNHGFSKLFFRDLKSGQQKALKGSLPSGVFSFSAKNFASNAPTLSLLVNTPSIAGDVWTLDGTTGVVKRDTKSATGGLDTKRFITPVPYSFKSFDGETVHGLLYLPSTSKLSVNGVPPLLLGVHGGPSSQAKPQYDPGYQYLLSRGIAVFDLNFRGSLGYGKRYMHLDDKRLRPNSIRDMDSAIEALGATGKVDISRTAVMGPSYGGFMTFAAVTEFPDRFRAAVSFVGVSNWVTALEGAPPFLRASDRFEYGDIDNPDDRKFFERISPIFNTHKIKAPIMVIHGANDPRDPPTESDQMVRAIRAQGGLVEYLRFPDEGHDLRKTSNRIIAYRRISNFLEKALSPTTAETP